MNSDFSAVDPHQRAADLIPWYVNGTLDAAESEGLAAHLEGCAPCRSDYEAQLRLFEAMQPDATLAFATEPSFKKLMARISSNEDAGELAVRSGTVRTPVIPAPARGRMIGRMSRWLAAAVVVEALALGLGVWAWHGRFTSSAPTYVTLTSPTPSYHEGARIRVVFRSALSVEGLGAILHEAGAHIIDGPTDSNVYTLGFAGVGPAPAVLEQKIAALRASSDVLFAEPLGVGSDSR